jgi:hypothetical protein
MREQYEGEIVRLQGMLRDAEGRCGLLESEVRKAHSVYADDEAKTVRRECT